MFICPICNKEFHWHGATSHLRKHARKKEIVETKESTGKPLFLTLSGNTIKHTCPRSPEVVVLSEENIDENLDEATWVEVELVSIEDGLVANAQ